jgi:prefoldin subunit 4
MATTKSKGSMNDDDVHITYEDQSKINRFAINNTKLHEYQDELVARNKELENLNEAIDELVILDDEEIVPFQHGEVFTNLKVQDVNVELDRAKKELEGVIKNLTDKIGSTKQVLSELKTALYAKFGSKINLEEAEE